MKGLGVRNLGLKRCGMPRPQSVIRSSFSMVLMCTKSYRIPASARTNQRIGKDHLVERYLSFLEVAGRYDTPSECDQIVFSMVLKCTKSHRIPASACTNQRPETDDSTGKECQFKTFLAMKFTTQHDLY